MRAAHLVNERTGIRRRFVCAPGHVAVEEEEVATRRATAFQVRGPRWLVPVHGDLREIVIEFRAIPSDFYSHASWWILLRHFSRVQSDFLLHVDSNMPSPVECVVRQHLSGGFTQFCVLYFSKWGDWN